MPREEFKAEDGSTVILTDTMTVEVEIAPTMGLELVMTMTDKESGCGFTFRVNTQGEAVDFGKIGQADAKVRLMIELPPDTEDSDGDS